MTSIQIRSIDATDADWITCILVENWLSTRIVSRGSVYNADQLPGFVASFDSKRVGLVTYRTEGNQCEIVTLNSLEEGMGIGTALVNAVRLVAVASKTRRLWLITTNANIEALRFYQRRGFSLVAIHRNALEESRKLKPEIPAIGSNGIPLRDELELKMLL